MSSRRTMVLIGAIAIGALAMFAVRSYVRGQEEAANPNPVQVYMITESIPRGTPFAQADALIKETTIPSKYRPETFVTDKKVLANKIALTDLAANQILVAGMFDNADVVNSGLKDRLEDGMVAIAVPIEGVRAVGGLLQAGDEVNIMVTTSPGEQNAGDQVVQQEQEFQTTVSPYTQNARYLYQKVRILSIGTSVRPQAGGEPTALTDSSVVATSAGSIVFEVPPEVAQRLASVDAGSFYLTLIPSDYVPRPLPALNPAEVVNNVGLPGELDGQLTPYGPAGYTGDQAGAEEPATEPTTTVGAN